MWFQEASLHHTPPSESREICPGYPYMETKHHLHDQQSCPCPVPVRPDFWTSDSSTSCIFYLSTCSSACTIPVCRRVRYGRSSFSDCWWVMLHPSWPRVPLFNRIWTPTSRGRDGRSRLHQLRDSSASSSSSPSPSPLSKPLRADKSHSSMPLLLSEWPLQQPWFPSPSCFSFPRQLSQPFPYLTLPTS